MLIPFLSLSGGVEQQQHKSVSPPHQNPSHSCLSPARCSSAAPPCSRRPVLPPDSAQYHCLPACLPPHGMPQSTMSMLPPLLRTAPLTASDARDRYGTTGGSLGRGEGSADGRDPCQRREGRQKVVGRSREEDGRDHGRSGEWRLWRKEIVVSGGA
jgi:hypothetical protein